MSFRYSMALTLLLVVLATRVQAAPALARDIDRLAAEVEAQVIEWRRDIHQNPELSNREVRTAALVAAELERLGLEVRTGIAHTGVVGVLRGGKRGGTVALRADMDGLPVTEQVDLPFASKARGEYNGQEVGVMHACGHDMHTASLLGAARVLTALREQLPGTVIFVFQPAEEGPPQGEEGGAPLMLEQNVFGTHKPQAIFALHTRTLPLGTIGYRSGPLMAASDRLRIVVHGRQTHGSQPWRGIDPVAIAAQIVTSAQTIVSRQTDITKSPAIVTFATIHGGVRSNIIPDDVELTGTIRTFEPSTQRDIHARLTKMAKSIAESWGATADVEISDPNPVTVNDPKLTAQMLPTVQRVVGAANVIEIPLVTGAEDFSYFAREVPGFYVFVGVTPKGQDPTTAATNHSPHFFVDEGSLTIGVRTLASLAVDFLAAGAR
jgi:amidohydrolase